jgi:hypothetical protein
MNLILLNYHFGAQGAWPAASSTAPLALVALPGQSTDDSWEATDVAWVCTDVGTADAQFSVRHGNFDGAGAWSEQGVITSGVTITSPGADNTGSQGRSTRLSVTIPNSSTVQSIGLFSDAQGTGVVSQGLLHVTVRLRRALMNF